MGKTRQLLSFESARCVPTETAAFSTFHGPIRHTMRPNASTTAMSYDRQYARTDVVYRFALLALLLLLSEINASYVRQRFGPHKCNSSLKEEN
jgi:hypothetical protein